MSDETETGRDGTQGIDQRDVLKILLATDIHLGYNEKDAIRGNDSFIAFEEILMRARTNDVDFILLGGDLFHDKKPSPNSINKCLQLLRTYTLGDRPITMEFLSEQLINFHDALNGTVNYEDPNLNIAYPVFSIHGNHDDPSGFSGVSSLDLLSTTGLVNYFGKCTDLTEININPILLRKGKTQLALYGLSHIHDNRLARLFNENKVKMNKPPADTGTWFNMLVLHQNRADRGEKNYIPENILPEFLDLILWGHEHDCRIEPEQNVAKHFYVTQPGSSVATSLSEGEAIEKHIGTLEIFENQFKLTALKLKTVRPFEFHSVDLNAMEEDLRLDAGDAAEKIQKFAYKTIEEMIEKAKGQITDHPEQPTLPLIRLRMLFNEEHQMFNEIRFGQQFTGKVANPSDCVSLKRKLVRVKGEKKAFDPDAMNNAFHGVNTAMDDVNVEDIVERYYNEAADDKKLEVLITKNMSELCRRLVQCDDDHAADEIINFTKNAACDFLNAKMPAEEDVDIELQNFRANSDQIYADTIHMLDARGTAGATARATPMDVADDVIDDDKENSDSGRKNTNRRGGAKAMVPVSPAPTRGKGSRGGRAATASRAKAPAATPNKKQLNVTTSKQPTIQQSISQAANRTSRGATRGVIYSLDSDDSD